MYLYRVKGFALPVSSERSFVQIECQYAEPLQLMIPQAVEELSLNRFAKRENRLLWYGTSFCQVLTAGRSASVLHDISVFMKFYTLLFKPHDSTFVIGQMSIHILIAAHSYQDASSVVSRDNSWQGHLSGMCE